MSVAPSCDIPIMAWTSTDGGQSERGKVVIVNLQNTDYDHYCELSGGFRIGAKIDEFMRMVMDALKLEVKEWSADKVYLEELEEEIKRIRVDPEFEILESTQGTKVDAIYK